MRHMAETRSATDLAEQILWFVVGALTLVAAGALVVLTVAMVQGSGVGRIPAAVVAPPQKPTLVERQPPAPAPAPAKPAPSPAPTGPR